MTLELLMTIFVVIFALVSALFSLHRYPLRILRRIVKCPEHNETASVRFVRREVDFGTLGIVEVKDSSLFPNGRIACSKK